jgi:predicted AAA+ superfamily ATPase
MSKPHYPRITRPPRGSFFLFGARGVGKSTWARSQFAKAPRVDLLDERRYQELLADPGLFGDQMRAIRRGSRVVVDEVQRIPGLLNEVHRFIEERDLRFALLGSSARKLKTSGTNLLAGRAQWKVMFPFVPEELGADFDVGAVLRYGSIPLIWASRHKRETLESYVQLYLREEIKAEALVRNLPGFVRFLPVAALFHGQTVNVSGIARDTGVARTTVSGYLDILEDTLLAYRLPAFEARLRVRERKHPKLYWVDPGLVRAVKKQLGPVTVEEKGPLLEGWILGLLRPYAAERRLCEEIHYWAPAQSRGAEVDFLLRRGEEFLAIEVKAGSRFSRSWLAGLKAIGDLSGTVRRIVVYTGRERLETEHGIGVWPLPVFLDRLRDGRLWP